MYWPRVAIIPIPSRTFQLSAKVLRYIPFSLPLIHRKVAFLLGPSVRVISAFHSRLVLQPTLRVGRRRSNQHAPFSFSGDCA